MNIETHINNIVKGDTILFNNVPTTVCQKDIKYDPFIGKTLFGDSYNLGHKPVVKIIIVK
jgi:hypothetical protein